MTMTASSPNKTIAALIEDTLRRSQDPAFPLSLLVEASARIATLLDDAPNQLWLIAERGTPTEAESVRLGTLLENRYGRERARQLHQASINDFNISRTITKDDVRMAGLKAEMEGQVVDLTVAELETQITTIENEITDLNKTRRPQFDTRWKDVNKLRSIQMWRKKTLALVRRRVIDYLFAMEREVWLRAAAEDIMAGPQQEVESWLSARSPDALEQLRAAKRRADEGDVEARSHALTSLRRLIKSVADTVYPPLSHDVVCADGRSRPLGEGQYLNRLREFAAKRIASSTSRELMFSAFEDLDRRLDLAHDLSSKGVPGEVTQFEVRLCFMQTFFLVGEVITMSRMAPV